MSAQTTPSGEESKVASAFDSSSAEAHQLYKDVAAVRWAANGVPGCGSPHQPHLTLDRDDCMGAAVYALLSHQMQGVAQLVDPARQAQNAAEAATRIANLENQVSSAAEIGAAAQPVLAALERMEATLAAQNTSLAAQNTRLAALEAQGGGCCVVS